MKVIKYSQFLTQVSSLPLQAGYLILGEDAYMIDQVYRVLREIVKQNIPSFEQINLYGDELKISELSDYIDSYSLFSDNRLLVIRNADRLGEEDKNRKQPDKQKQMLELLNQYFENPESSQVIILIAESIDSRMTGWKKIKETCLTIDCEPIKYAGEMKVWVEKKLKDNNKKMNDAAKDHFLEKVELDFCVADNELDKLLIYTESKNIISISDVNATLPTSRTGTLKEFYNALGNRQLNYLFVKVDEMLDNNWADLQILSILIKFFTTIWKIHALKAKHISDSEISRTHMNDIFANQRNDYLAYARNFKPEEIPEIFSHLLKIDSDIKLSVAESKVLLSICLTKICRGISD